MDENLLTDAPRPVLRARQFCPALFPVREALEGRTWRAELVVDGDVVECRGELSTRDDAVALAHDWGAELRAAGVDVEGEVAVEPWAPESCAPYAACRAGEPCLAHSDLATDEEDLAERDRLARRAAEHFAEKMSTGRVGVRVARDFVSGLSGPGMTRDARERAARRAAGAPATSAVHVDNQERLVRLLDAAGIPHAEIRDEAEAERALCGWIERSRRHGVRLVRERDQAHAEFAVAFDRAQSLALVVTALSDALRTRAPDVDVDEVVRAFMEGGYVSRDVLLTPAVDGLAQQDDRRERCGRCGRRSPVGFDVADEAWARTVRGRWRVLCASCFDEEARAARVRYSFRAVHPVTWSESEDVAVALDEVHDEEIGSALGAADELVHCATTAYTRAAARGEVRAVDEVFAELQHAAPDCALLLDAGRRVHLIDAPWNPERDEDGSAGIVAELRSAPGGWPVEVVLRAPGGASLLRVATRPDEAPRAEFAQLLRSLGGGAPR